MVLNLPQRGDANWDTPLNAALNTLDSRVDALTANAFFTGYDYEIHVSQVDGNDTLGNGDFLKPVATITKALTLVSAQRKTIIIHPGTYTENPSITVQYTVLTTLSTVGGNTLISGTVTTNTGCTISGLKMTNLTITAPTGTGNVNVLNCDISGTLTKNNSALYTLVRFTDFNTASITGTGLVDIYGGTTNFVTVNNAGATVLIKNGTTVSPVLTAGNLSLVQTVVVAAVTNAVTTAASSVITMANCQIVNSTLTNVAPVVLNGFYSIVNCVYNKPSSTLVATSATGGSTNSIDYFQYINADKFITQGGTANQYLKGDGSLGVHAPGSWNPAFRDSTGTLAGITQTGNYTQIGNMVFFCVNVDFAGYTNLGTGQYDFTLPFQPKQTFTARGGTLHNVTTDSRYHIAAIVDVITDGPTAKAKLYYTGSTTDLAWKYSTPVNWASQTTHFDISGFYEKA